MPDRELTPGPDDRADAPVAQTPPAPPASSPPPAKTAWPALPEDVRDVADALAACGSPAPRPSPAFTATLRDRFTIAATHAIAAANTANTADTPTPAGSPSITADHRTAVDPIPAAAGTAEPRRARRPGHGVPAATDPRSARRWSRWPLAAGLIAAAAIAAVFVAPRLGGVAPPPPVDRTALVARNAQAWAGLTTLTGAFETGDGWYYEEWIRRSPDGELRFKRYIRPPARTPNRPQWNISDGATEWVIDADTRRVRVTRAAVPGDFTAVAPNDTMQCTSLALPAGAADGPPPVPVVLDGRPAYRVAGRLADGAAAVFWVDAADALVRRIDRPGFGTVWRRGRLAVDPPLTADVFHPQSLVNL